MKTYRKQQQYIYRLCQLCHVTTSYAVIVGVCVLMLPMLELATEHVQLTTTCHINHVHPPRINAQLTFSHIHLLPFLSNVLPAMVLQNQLSWSNTKRSFHSRVCHAGLSPAPTAPTVLGRRVVVLLLLLMSGDIETNPGPLSKCTFLISIGGNQVSLGVLETELYHHSYHLPD